MCGDVGPKQNRKMGKTKSKDKDAGEADTTQDKTMEEENSERPPYEELVKQISIISKPLASKKLTKKLFKTIKKGRGPADDMMPAIITNHTFQISPHPKTFFVK